MNFNYNRFIFVSIHKLFRTHGIFAFRTKFCTARAIVINEHFRIPKYNKQTNRKITNECWGYSRFGVTIKMPAQTIQRLNDFMNPWIWDIINAFFFFHLFVTSVLINKSSQKLMPTTQHTELTCAPVTFCICKCKLQHFCCAGHYPDILTLWL